MRIRYFYSVLFLLSLGSFGFSSMASQQGTASAEVLEDASFSTTVVRNPSFGSFYSPSSGRSLVILEATDAMNSSSPAQTGNGSINFAQSGAIERNLHKGGNRVGIVTATSSVSGMVVDLSITGNDLTYVDGSGRTHTLDYTAKLARNSRSNSLGVTSATGVLIEGTRRHFFVTGVLGVEAQDPPGDYSGTFTFIVNN